MQMPELDADFEISTNNLEAEYEITQSEHFDCSFEIYASGTTWGSITGNIEEQTDLQDILSDLQSNIDDVADDLSIETDNRQTADADLQDNIDTVDGKIDTHIADKSNPHEVTKAQIGLGNVDNTSDLNKPISTATQTALNGKQNTISDLSEIRTNASNGQSAYNTIQNYGDIVTYDASSFATSTQGQKADTALQPNDNITKLNNNAGFITSASLPTVNNNKITIQKNSTDAGSFTLNQSSDKTINISVPTQASDINAVPTSRKINNKPLSSDITLTASDVNALSSSTTINDLTTSAQQDALNSGATSTNIGQIATNTQNITNEVTNRQNADNNLQSQIDAIVASSDVFDIVGTYAELQAYDISTVPVNDIIKVLVDSTHSNAATYYRCVETGGVKSWSYIGSEGAYYTKSESDSLFVEQTTTVNNKPLSTNITLTASDVGALPSSTTIGNGALTIQNNSVDVDTFNANATSNKTINIVTPTKTSDLTNDSGFIDSSALSGLVTQTDLTNGLATKQDTISDLSTIRSNATNGQSAYTTIGGYGDIVTYNASNFVQKNGGSSTQTISLTSGTGTTALGIKSMATSSYISLSGSSGWLGSFGVTSNKRPAFYNGTGYTLAYTSEIPTNTSDLINDSGFITGIGSNDVITALGYTPASNSAFTGADGTNAGSSGLVPAPSATDNDKYLKGDGTWASVSSGSSTDVQINGTSITSGGVANILTQTAYNASSNKIATMSDIPADKIFVATYGTTTFNEVWTAYDAGKAIFVKDDTTTAPASAFGGILAVLNYFEFNSGLDAHFEFASSILNDGTYYTYTLDHDSTWSEYTEQIPDTSGFANTDLSNLTATGEAHFLKNTATGDDALTILGNPTSYLGGLNIGAYSTASNNYGIAIGNGTSTTYTTASGASSIAIGHTAKATAECSIQIGNGTNSTARTVYIGGWDSSGSPKNYQILNIETGLMPDERISANIQRTSTAVTHTASTQVGGASTPVYIASNGTATSTGLSIANSRFDGQWVRKFTTLANDVSMGNGTSKTYSLASYLPDATYDYEVMFSGLVITASSSGKFLKMVLGSSVVNNIWVCDARTRTSSTMEATGSCIVPISKNSQQIEMRSEASSNSSGTMSLVALAYRRIGTNT